MNTTGNYEKNQTLTLEAKPFLLVSTNKNDFLALTLKNKDIVVMSALNLQKSSRVRLGNSFGNSRGSHLMGRCSVNGKLLFMIRHDLLL